ncbi:Scr1 family TA system antitoxin-like transcriptional regulator [Streptomyces sp. NPDC057963]|uniref:Scr1 family TA system antitoxin-like transcriptional regulator n=1 Tax=Streptomyces sp. NPDC057963 TaxID=3346290 RepID=UPI0036E6036B
MKLHSVCQPAAPAVARNQLRHLVEQSEREHTTVQVFPFAIGAHPGSGQTVLYVYGAVSRLGTVSLDQSYGPVLADARRSWSQGAGMGPGCRPTGRPAAGVPPPVHAATVAPDGRLVAGFGAEAAVLPLR